MADVVGTRRIDILISPAEPKALYSLGTVSPLPEEHGCDFLWLSHGEFVGCQRKSAADFQASMYDGRLADLKAKSTDIGRVILLLEGFFWEDWPVGVQLAIQAAGFWIIHTASLADTAHQLVEMERWFGKEDHGSLFAPPRSKQPVGVRQWEMLLNGSPKTARLLYEELGAPLTLREDITVERLIQIKGVGKKIAEKVLNGSST